MATFDIDSDVFFMGRDCRNQDHRGQILKKRKNKIFYVINPFGAESVQNFGIFLNFNFPRNTFKYSKFYSHEGLQRDKTSKRSFILSLKIIWDSFYPLDPKI